MYLFVKIVSARKRKKEKEKLEVLPDHILTLLSLLLFLSILDSMDYVVNNYLGIFQNSLPLSISALENLKPRRSQLPAMP